MNRRNLFQACAAGLAWLVGGKLPTVEIEPHVCDWHKPRYIVVKNLSGRALKPKSLAFWTSGGDGVTDKFLDGHGPAGVVAYSYSDHAVIQTYGACEVLTTR
jgi:hypothetical protein